MSKIKVHATLQNITEKTEHIIETTGIYRDNIITYSDENVLMSLKMEKESIHMKRIQNEDVLDCIFISPLTTTGIYDIKSVNITFDIKIQTKKLIIQENKIEIAYEMALAEEPSKKFNYELEYEVIP